MLIPQNAVSAIDASSSMFTVIVTIRQALYLPLKSDPYHLIFKI